MISAEAISAAPASVGMNKDNFKVNIYSGLWYPLIGAAFTFIVGLIFLPETKATDLRA